MTSIEELKAEKAVLAEEIESILDQIERAKEDEQEGILWEKGWLPRANRALRAKRRRVQEIMAELGEMRRQHNAALADQTHHRFVNAAREMLDSATFYAILDVARKG
jgi:hypothetical protein